MFGMKATLIVAGVLLSIMAVMGWMLKNSWQENAIKQMENDALVESAIQLNLLHEKEKGIIKFNAKYHAKKEDLEKAIKRTPNANVDIIDNDIIYFSY